MGSTMWPTQSVGLTDHPHILSCEPVGLSTAEEEGTLKDFRALSRHFSNNPRACTLPARTACLSRSLPQLVGKDLARGTPGYFGMLLRPCVSCRPAPHSELLTTRRAVLSWGREPKETWGADPGCQGNGEGLRNQGTEP